MLTTLLGAKTCLYVNKGSKENHTNSNIGDTLDPPSLRTVNNGRDKDGWKAYMGWKLKNTVQI